MYYVGMLVGLIPLALLALVPWLGLGNILGSMEVKEKEKKRTLFMPIYKDK